MTSEMSISHRWAEITTPLSNQHDCRKEQLVDFVLRSASLPRKRPLPRVPARLRQQAHSLAQQALLKPSEVPAGLSHRHKGADLGCGLRALENPAVGVAFCRSQPWSQPHPHRAAFIPDGFTRLSRQEAESS